MNRNEMKTLPKAALNMALPIMVFILIMDFASIAFAAASVDLGNASTFAILTYAGITDVPTSVITGDIGTSPASGALIGVTCAEVTGTIYAVDDTGPPCKVINSTLLGLAMGSITTAYDDALSRPIGVLNAGDGAGEIGGLTLAPAVYTFTGASINVLVSTDLVLNGNSTDVWIFQIPGTFDLATGKQVNLTGGALPKNVYWAIAGASTLHANSVMSGNILDHTSVAMQNLAILNGRAFSATESVTLDANTITKPADTTPPTVNLNTQNNMWTNDNQSELNFTFSDEESATASCDLIINGVIYNSSLSATNNVATLIMPDSPLLEGAQNWTVECVDESNNSGTSSTRVFNVDTISPVVNVSVLQSRAHFNSMEVPIVVNVTETNLNVAKSNLSIINSSGAVVNYTALNGTGTYMLTVPEYGVYGITALAVDIADNSGTDTNTNITVEIIPLTSNTSYANATMPSATSVIGNLSWNGTINGPSNLSNATVAPSTPGYTTTVSKVIEIGTPGISLTLSRAVKVVLYGETGKKVGYTNDGSTFVKITTVCADNTQVTNDLLPDGGDCYYDDGVDLTLWTKHFTEFITYIENPYPGAVNLRTAGNFVILAKTGVSTTGTSYTVGNIGVSPIDSTAVTGFGLILDSSTQYSTSSLVDGRVYAADYSVPTPTVLGVAIGDMQTAYTDAAGRAPDYTELGAGNIGGMTLAPGVYKWSSGVTIPTDVTLEGNGTEVWIFQIAQTLSISSDKKILLSGGADANNIFWQVADTATIGTGATFNGNILGQTDIVLTTGAIFNGRALAQTAVTLDSNAVTTSQNASADILPPIVTLNTPNNTWTTDNQSKLNFTFVDSGTATAMCSLILNGVVNNASLNTTNNVSTLIAPNATLADGVYNWTVNCTDSDGNVGTAVSRVFNVDTTDPVITLVGTDPMNVTQFVNYTEPGATGFDAVSGNTTVFTSGFVNTSEIGTYVITYNTTDETNHTTVLTRTVNVVADTFPPVITLVGTDNVNVTQYMNYTELGANAVDEVSGNATVFISGFVNTSEIGTYTITYNATDALNNTAFLTRTVNVVADTFPPVITLVGASTVNVTQYLNYTELGASAFDEVSGNTTVFISGFVNTSEIGTYTITYNSTDDLNNTAVLTRTVNVVADTFPPVITLNGASTVTVTQNTAYTDSGASALDDVNGAVNVTSSGTVNTAVVGTYTITYNATDAANNTAILTRTVNVVAAPSSGSGSSGSGSSGGSGGSSFAPRASYTTTPTVPEVTPTEVVPNEPSQTIFEIPPAQEINTTPRRPPFVPMQITSPTPETPAQQMLTAASLNLGDQTSKFTSALWRMISQYGAMAVMLGLMLAIVIGAIIMYTRRGGRARKA